MTINWPKNNLDTESQAWRRKVEEVLDTATRDGSIQRANTAAAIKAASSTRSALNRAGLDIADQQKQLEQAARIPAAPSDPGVTTDAYFDEYGYARAEVFATSSIVDTDGHGVPIGVVRYELAGRKNEAGESWAIIAETPAFFGVAPELHALGLPAGEEWALKVRAISEAGVAGEYSGETVALLAKDETPPPKPSAPVVSSRLGQVMVNWDGLPEGGGTQPPDFSHCEVLMAESFDGTGYKVGTIDAGGDTFYAPEQHYGVTRWFYLIAVDVAGNRSDASERDDATVQPLVDTDVIGEIIDGANIVPDSITASEKIIGETITGGLIQALAIGAGHLKANAVTADKVDAGAITTVKLGAGAVTADKIQARTIGADKLLIGNTQNSAAIPPDTSKINDLWLGDTAGWFVAEIGGAWQGVMQMNGINGGGQVWSMPFLQVRPGDQIFASVGIRAYNKTAGNYYARVLYMSATGAHLGSTSIGTADDTWSRYSGTVTVPSLAGVAQASLSIIWSPGTVIGAAYIAVPELRLAVTGQLIVDGAIDGKVITGALIRSAASGARTEMTSSGIRVLNASNQELVKLGYGIGTGMEVRNPHTGTLVPLANAAFGATSISRNNVIAHTAAASTTTAANGGPGTFAGWTRHSSDTLTLTFTAVAPTYLLQFGQVWATNQYAGASLQIFVAPTVNGVRVTAANGPFSIKSDTINCGSSNAELRVASANGAIPIATSPGTTYTIQLQFRTLGWHTTTIGASVADRFITATPVFQ